MDFPLEKDIVDTNLINFICECGWHLRGECPTCDIDIAPINPLKIIEVGDWVAYRDSSENNIHLVTARLYGNSVNLHTGHYDVPIRFLIIVHKNNRPTKEEVEMFLKSNKSNE